MNTLRNLLFSTLAVLVLFTAIGCDSSSDDDDNIFEGSWELSAISDTGGDNGAARDLTPVFFQGITDLTANFRESDFDLSVDYNALGEAAGSTDLTIDGPYTFTDSVLNLSIPSRGVSSFPLTYDVVNNDQVRLTGSASIVNAIFGTTLYVGNVTLTIDRQ